MDDKLNTEATLAAAVLTNLGISSPQQEKAADEEEDDFEIPQRYTKSGRKRAVSFPLKVGSVAAHTQWNVCSGGQAVVVLNSVPFLPLCS